jgi:hypothetical protein
MLTANRFSNQSRKCAAILDVAAVSTDLFGRRSERVKLGHHKIIKPALRSHTPEI